MRLTKRDVEALLRDYDDDPVAALTVALRKTLELEHTGWVELVAAAPMSNERRVALLRKDAEALDDLAAQLNEERLLRR